MKYLAIIALLFAAAMAQHPNEIRVIAYTTQAISHGFQSGLYTREPEISHDCTGDWADPVLEELLDALDNLLTDTYGNLVTILKDSFYYLYQNYYFCNWNNVFADLDAFCTSHEKNCNPVNVINRLVNDKDKYARYSKDIKSRLVVPETEF